MSSVSSAVIGSPRPYKWNPLPSPRHIRLLNFSPLKKPTQAVVYSLETFSIDDCPPYEALSYTWGPPTRGMHDDFEATMSAQPTKKMLIVDDLGTPRILDVTENLSQALVRIGIWKFLMPETSRYVWIDAICVNQDDFEERASQVLLMGDVFANVEQVIVYLGDDMSDIDAKFIWLLENVLPVLRDTVKTRGWQWLAAQVPYDPAVWSQISSLRLTEREWLQHWQSAWKFCYRHRWFSRAWAAQEVVLNSNSSFILGPLRMPFTLITAMTEWLAFLRWDFTEISQSDLSGPEVGHIVPNAAIINQLACLFQVEMDEPRPVAVVRFVAGAQTAEQRWFSSIARLLREIRNYNATDPRDKVYSILGLAQRLQPAEISFDFRVDYTSPVPEVYTHITSALLSKLPLLLVLSYVDTDHRSTPRFPELPSWVPDYSAQALPPLAEDIRPIDLAFDASLSRGTNVPQVEVNGAELSLYGAKLDVISHLGLSLFQGDRHTHLAALLDICLRMDATYAPTGEDAVEVLRRTLLCSMGVHGDDPEHGDDPGHGDDAALASMGAAFHDWTVFLACTAAQDRPDQASELRALIAAVAGRSQRARQLLPARKELRTAAKAERAARASRTARSFSWGSTHRIAPRLVGMAMRRRLGLTGAKLLGLMPPTAREGDEVWLLRGAVVPFVLRRAEEGTYRLVGEAYVHGAMYGEMMTEETRASFHQIRIV